MRFVKPLAEALIKQLAQTPDVLVTLEENAIAGGAGAGVIEILMKRSSSSRFSISAYQISSSCQVRKKRCMQNLDLMVQALSEQFATIWSNSPFHPPLNVAEVEIRREKPS